MQAWAQQITALDMLMARYLSENCKGCTMDGNKGVVTTLQIGPTVFPGPSSVTGAMLCSSQPASHTERQIFQGL